MSEWYAQHGEDRWVAENIPLPSKGVMVEVGVGRWKEYSNSLYWEQQGWQVILVEPNPELHPEIETHRTGRLFTCAAGNYDGNVEFVLHNEPTLSGVRRTDGRKIFVPIRKLNTILDEAGVGHIDILSIDTEGSELDVWDAMDLAKHTPSVVIIEFSTIGLPEDPMVIIRNCLPKGYTLAAVLGGNLVFVNERVEPPTIAGI